MVKTGGDILWNDKAEQRIEPDRCSAVWVQATKPRAARSKAGVGERL